MRVFLGYITKGKLSQGKFTNEVTEVLASKIKNTYANKLNIFLTVSGTQEDRCVELIYNEEMKDYQKNRVLNITNIYNFLGEKVTIKDLKEKITKYIEPEYKNFIFCHWGFYYIENCFNKGKIVSTAYYKNKKSKLHPLRMLILKQEVYTKLFLLYKSRLNSYLDTACKKMNINFIVVQKDGVVLSKHITIEENLLVTGFRKEEYDWINDLGEGIYTYLNTEKGRKNINLYINSQVEYDDVPVYRYEIGYKGKYLQCIYGLNHEDYLVLQNKNNLKILKKEKVKIARY